MIMETIIWTGAALLVFFITVEIAWYIIDRHKVDTLEESQALAFEDTLIHKEIQTTLAYEPTNREIILFRALSRFYEEGTRTMVGEDPVIDAVIDEAFHALGVASHSWRNALTEHTFVPEDERAEDNPHRIDWEWPSDIEYWA
jgi:hypothetical protein